MGGATRVDAGASPWAAAGDPEEPFPEDLAPLADELVE
jgi:hypothetical protein